MATGMTILMILFCVITHLPIPRVTQQRCQRRPVPYRAFLSIFVCPAGNPAPAKDGTSAAVDAGGGGPAVAFDESGSRLAPAATRHGHYGPSMRQRIPETRH